MSSTSILPQLIRASARLPAPRDYYKGVGTGEMLGLRSVLCFVRTNPAHLASLTRHLHHRSVLVLNLLGDGTLGIEERLYELKVGEALLIRPHEVHYFPKRLSPKMTWLFVTFEGGAELLQQIRPAPVPLNPRAFSVTHLLLESYHSESAAERRPEDCPALLLLLLNELARTSRRTRKLRIPPEDVQTQKITSNIYTGLHQPRGLKEIAGELGMSESNLRRTFRKRSGQSVGSFIRRAKLARAAALLSRSELPVGEVAEAAGYTSIYTFSRAFTMAMGKSPRAYRRDFQRSAAL